MIIYIVEFAILHLLFFGIYKVMLSRETQLGFLRLFLVGSTILSLTLPLLEIPTTASIPTINMDAIILPMMSVNTEVQTFTLPWYLILTGVICSLFFLKFIVTLIQIYGWYRQSETDSLDDIVIRKVSGLQNSFTFLQWIFIDPKNFENPADIIRHEQGHAKKLHSLDLLFFHILTIFFWWLPSIWLMIRELKEVHEFEADDYALKINDSTYTKTLVQCTLKAHGMDLASSFDDAPIFNRLNFIKKMKKKISIWKVASIATMVAVSGAMFACEEELEAGIEEIVEESNQQLEYSDDIKTRLAKLKNENPGEKYSVIITEFTNETEIRKLDSYDPNQIEAIIVSKDGENKNVALIVKQSSEVLKTAIEIQEKQSNDVYRIVENTASFPGGLDDFKKYLRENIRYPKQAQNLGVEGKVYVQIIVEKNGDLSEIEVVKGIGAGCDKEAVRVLEESPNWEPATIGGKAVRQKVIINVGFELNS